MSSTPVYAANFATTPLRQRKVAIPRLQTPGRGQNATKDRRRVPRACTAVCCNFSKLKNDVGTTAPITIVFEVVAIIRLVDIDDCLANDAPHI